MMNLRTFGLVMLGGVVTACAATTRGGSAVREETTVTVDNQSFYDMNIYALRGQRVRLGTARGKTKTVFTIPSSLVGGSPMLRFIADPVGSSRASVSEEISVSEGDSIGITIPPP